MGNKFFWVYMAVVRLIFRPCVGNHPMGVRFVARNHPSVCVADSSPLGEPSINLGSILAPLEGSSGESR